MNYCISYERRPTDQETTYLLLKYPILFGFLKSIKKGEWISGRVVVGNVNKDFNLISTTSDILEMVEMGILEHNRYEN